MRALIIAGGLGTRLRPLTDHVPKSLLPIGNVPFLEHQVRLLARHGVEDVTLLTGYLPEDFGPFAQQMTRHGVRLEISTEREPLGTAGAVRSQLDRLEGTTLVLNGDVLTDFDVGAMLRAHAARGAQVTMALARVEDSGGYGVVPLREDDRVEAFVQNPKGEGFPPAWINAGIYAMEPEVIARIPAGEFRDFERPPGDPLFPTLVAEGAPFYGFRATGYWIDIGTPDRYLRANQDVLAGGAGFHVEGTLLREDKDLHDGTRIRGPVLLSHAPVGARATLGPLTVLGQGCRIGEEAVVERSVVHAGARVGERAIVRDSVLGSAAIVEPGAVVEHEVLA